MGFKISPRAIGKRSGLQLPFSIILALRSRAESRTIRARRNNPGGLFRCFVRGRAKAAPEMRIPTRRADYRLGSLYSLLTAVLVATQEPFSALAARRLSSSYFIFLTQFALLLSVPLLTLPRSSRRCLG